MRDDREMAGEKSKAAGFRTEGCGTRRLWRSVGLEKFHSAVSTWSGARGFDLAS